MANIVFQKSGLSDLTLERGRLFPVKTEIEANQENYLTESLNPKVVDYGSTLEIWELEFVGLSKDNYDGTVNGLKTWFNSSQVNWMANNFTLIDEAGTSHTVRLWNKKFAMDEDSANRYGVKLVFLKE